jgi:hypothetical protein
MLAEVMVSTVPWSVHPDRLAAACCLLFNESAASFQLPGEGCAPHVAAAIEAFFEPTMVNVYPINYNPSRIVGGEVELNLAVDAMGLAPLEMTTSGEHVLLRLTEESIGMMATSSELWVTTNAALLSTDSVSHLRRLLPALGIALLYCEDFFVGNLILPESMVNSDTESKVENGLEEKLRRLLDSIGLRLCWA